MYCVRRKSMQLSRYCMRACKPSTSWATLEAFMGTLLDADDAGVAAGDFACNTKIVWNSVHIDVNFLRRPAPGVLN